MLSEDNIDRCLHLESICDGNRGEQICRKCGKVLVQNMVDYASDAYLKDFTGSRTGPKISVMIHDGGLSTMMGLSNRDSSGQPLPNSMKGSFKRMRVWDSRSKTKNTSQRNLVVALSEIKKLKEKMSLSDAIVERAAYLYRKASEGYLIRGRTVKGIVGACIYAACRDFGTMRTIIEISKNTHERKNIISRSYRMLFQELSLDVAIPDPTSSIVRFSNNLDLSEKIKRDAIRILDILKEKQVVAGKKPGAVAGTVIYMACIRNNKNISQQKIAKISGTSGVTIRNRFKEYKKYVELL